MLRGARRRAGGRRSCRRGCPRCRRVVPRERMWKLSRQVPSAGWSAARRSARRGRTRRRAGPRRAPRRRRGCRARGPVGERAQLLGREVVVVDARGPTLEQTSTVSAPSRPITSNFASARRRLRGELRRAPPRCPERLVEVDAPGRGRSARADLVGGGGEPRRSFSKISTPSKPAPRGGRQLLGEGAAEADGGDGLTHARGFSSGWGAARYNVD